MTDRDRSRHRSSQRPSTPLSVIASGVGANAGTLGRSGVVVAMSSGLVATLGLPAQVLSAGPAAASGAPARPSLLAGTAVTASPIAKVSFEKAGFAARPAVVKAATPQVRPARTGPRTPLTTTAVGGFASARGASVLAIAARYVGTPYRYGGTTPAGFDCSGYVQYVFRLLGYHLPRTADQQMRAVRHISRADAVAGDLVFFVSPSGRAYHDAIYAGGGMIYDSPRTGKTIQKRAIWSANVVFGRVTG